MVGRATRTYAPRLPITSSPSSSSSWSSSTSAHGALVGAMGGGIVGRRFNTDLRKLSDMIVKYRFEMCRRGIARAGTLLVLYSLTVSPFRWTSTPCRYVISFKPLRFRYSMNGIDGHLNTYHSRTSRSHQHRPVAGDFSLISTILRSRQRTKSPYHWTFLSKTKTF